MKLLLFILLVFLNEKFVNNLNVLNCTCGYLSKRFKRITGGRDVVSSSHPWFASIVRYLEKEDDISKPYCGGSLISNQYILTAGHCLFNKKPDQNRILLDLYDLNDFNESLNLFKIKKFIVHPDYVDDLKHPKNDIGLIQLEQPINITSKILPICLPDVNQTGYNDTDVYFGLLTTIGWGRIGKNSDSSERLQLIRLFQDFDSCSLVFGDNVHRKHICIKDTRKIKTGWKDVCKGDSGGPLIVKEEGLNKIVGLTSFSSCLGIPAAVFTKIRIYLSWIKQNTLDSSYCNNEFK